MIFNKLTAVPIAVLMIENTVPRSQLHDTRDSVSLQGQRAMGTKRRSPNRNLGTGMEPSRPTDSCTMATQFSCMDPPVMIQEWIAPGLA